jgi:hypothetical protein
MAAVAVIAILLAGAVTTIKVLRLREAAYRFRQAARYHRQQERLIIIRAQDIRTGQDVGPMELTRINRVWKGHHAALRRKYECATAHPQISLPSDPPHPILQVQPHLTLFVEDEG